MEFDEKESGESPLFLGPMGSKKLNTSLAIFFLHVWEFYWGSDGVACGPQN